MLSFTHSFPFLCVFSVSKEMCEAFFSCKLGYLTARSFTTVHSKGKKVVIDMLHDKVHDSTEQAGITFKLQVKGCLLCMQPNSFGLTIKGIRSTICCIVSMFVVSQAQK